MKIGPSEITLNHAPSALDATWDKNEIYLRECHGRYIIGSDQNANSNFDSIDSTESITIYAVMDIVDVIIGLLSLQCSRIIQIEYSMRISNYSTWNFNGGKKPHFSFD